MGELTPGMAVSTRDASQRLVVTATKREHQAAGISVYNCEVEDDHAYFVGQAAGGAYVHNVCFAGHHGFPKFLGGNSDQLLKYLPKELHNAYHGGLRKRLTDIGIHFPKGEKWNKYLLSLPQADQKRVLEEFLRYTTEFDAEHGTDLMKYVLDEAENL